MKINFKSCTAEELWKYVASALSKNGIESVLVGGAVVSIYTKGLYQSGDLDFIVQNSARARLPEIMASLGFKKTDRHYAHPECKHLFVEFPSGPLSIGEAIRIRPKEQKVEKQVIKILSPTDCIKDRLASYIHFKSRETLEQAAMVAQKQPFNLAAVRKWCKEENAIEQFKEFQRALKLK